VTDGFFPRHNGRFKGGYTTRHYGRPQHGVHAVQMELACRGYLREPAGVSTRATGRALGMRNSPPPMRAVLERNPHGVHRVCVGSAGLEAQAKPDRDEFGRLLGLGCVVARLDEPGLTGRQREVHPDARIHAKRVVLSLAHQRVAPEARPTEEGVAQEAILVSSMRRIAQPTPPVT